jgi:hypothetical protein
MIPFKFRGLVGRAPVVAAQVLAREGAPVQGAGLHLAHPQRVVEQGAAHGHQVEVAMEARHALHVREVRRPLPGIERGKPMN